MNSNLIMIMRSVDQGRRRIWTNMKQKKQPKTSSRPTSPDRKEYSKPSSTPADVSTVGQPSSPPHSAHSTTLLLHSSVFCPDPTSLQSPQNQHRFCTNSPSSDKNPSIHSNFQPISLCNFPFKPPKPDCHHPPSSIHFVCPNFRL